MQSCGHVEEKIQNHSCLLGVSGCSCTAQIVSDLHHLHSSLQGRGSFGYSSVLYCLRILWVWKSVLNVVADNCAAPPIGWLVKSFSSSFVWVRSHSFRWKKWRRGHFSSRERHEMHVHTVQENTSLTHVESRGSAHLERIKIISMFCQVTLLMCCTICLRV